ncbi:MAG: RES family NAD+ phosphorylase [Gammaproteobacteria bacterium]|nr:RES family NAD+ phosphorylase [Gammaproteobacteria bacterium]
MTTPITEETWRKAYRIISSRFPPVSVFDNVSDPADLEAIFYVESLTNPRMRDEMGQISLIAPEDRIAGPGTTPIMAAFTHLNPSGSRFTNGDYSVYYAADSQKTAVTESLFHVQRWAKESNDPATSFVMRVYTGRLNKRPYHDLRSTQAGNAKYFNSDPEKYGPAQQLGAKLRAENSWGILYNSVRNSDGACAAVFRPSALGVVHQGAHLAYHWDGETIIDVLELRSLGLPST